jgi:hypothetical protein
VRADPARRQLRRRSALLRALHRDYLPQHGLTPTGHHHEIYLNDARRTHPSKLKVVLRQPVTNDQAADR